MKFLEITTTKDCKVFIELSKITSIEVVKVKELTMYAIVFGDEHHMITEDEYNRITQTIDKVDHL